MVQNTTLMNHPFYFYLLIALKLLCSQSHVMFGLVGNITGCLHFYLALLFRIQIV